MEKAGLGFHPLPTVGRVGVLICAGVSPVRCRQLFTCWGEEISGEKPPQLCALSHSSDPL